jgi:Clr5 domain
VGQGSQCILWRSCIGLLLGQLPCLLPGLVWSRGSAALDFCSANRSYLARQAQVGPSNFYIATEPHILDITKQVQENYKSTKPSHSTHLFNLLGMELVGSQDEIPVASRLSDTPGTDGPRPQSLAKKDWDGLKPKIRELYLDQKQTIQQVAKYLEEHYGFRPT